MIRFLDTAFAKIVSTPDGWDSILIEGQVISLAVNSRDANNEIVSAIVGGLRSAQCNAQIAVQAACSGSAADNVG